MALWLYLHFPSLQRDTLYHDCELPLIIVDGRQNEVVQLTSAAKQEGIQLGMGLGSAASLCTSLQVLPYDEATEAKTLKQIARWLYLVTADIALYPPNGLLVKVSNMLTLYKDLGQYWQKLQSHLKHFAVEFHYCTGLSPYGARMLARKGINQVSDNKDWLNAQVAKCALIESDLEPKAITSLQKVGVQQFSDLLRLPLADLSKRFNLNVVNYITRLTGTVEHKVEFYIPAEAFEQYLELYYEVSNLQFLEKPITKLYKRLETYLKLRDKLACELLITLHQRDKDDLQLTVAAAQGEYKASKWWQLTNLCLESVDLAAPVIGVSVKASRVVNQYAERNDLFQGSQGSLSATELVSILTAKLGEDRVQGLSIGQDHRPELANQLCPPFTVSNELNGDIPLRPSVMLATPVALNEHVTLQPYPERIVTGWWDSQQAVRDYFIGRSDSGRWLWLFRNADKQWFVHGVFS
ncbi:DNA polymerase Y family protein [Shewanella sp. WXL01]|uniref:Y-family DNA polymerase n=1 Tax=Shewanella sp. WXL01 TaxID=2709721 RepID=UPI0014383BDA|nr:DNA polymerase Y family protein [Shewanella sp. WXL01]NKF51241.1 DNA polymerase Y family protein [Shewanella sp. WXL01]